MSDLWLRFGYRPWARLLHRFNLHHTRRSYPDGDVVDRCDWCGLSGRVLPTVTSSCGVRIRRVKPEGVSQHG